MKDVTTEALLVQFPWLEREFPSLGENLRNARVSIADAWDLEKTAGWKPGPKAPLAFMKGFLFDEAGELVAEVHRPWEHFLGRLSRPGRVREALERLHPKKAANVMYLLFLTEDEGMLRLYVAPDKKSFYHLLVDLWNISMIRTFAEIRRIREFDAET